MKAGARFACLLAFAALAGEGQASDVSFQNDVMAVLSKAGCNAGTCHGNRNGKGGFKLSLRGQDPELDFLALTREAGGRRTNRLEPTRSLILLKPTGEVSHEGGLRFSPGSLEFEILERWIAGGCAPDGPSTPRLVTLKAAPEEEVLVEPRDGIQLQARAAFSDGTERDVTRLSVYEPSNTLATVTRDGRVERQGFGETTVLVRYLSLQVPVRLAFVPARPGFAWKGPEPANYIDEHVFAKLQALRINPSELASDSVFFRRACLDAIGILPTADEARAFLADGRPDKRALWIDKLLERPEFADFWALKWSDLLRNEEKVLDRKGVEHFHGWIRRSILDGKPLDQFARELVTARGSTYRNPAANYYRANRDPVSRAETTAQVFLGTRLQCAKCHNHPFDRWTQDDYYGWMAFFSRVGYKILENHRQDKNDQHEFVGEQVVWVAREGDMKDPRTGNAVLPRFLGSPGEGLPGEGDWLEALAAWMTRPENPLFARAQVNRVWYHLLGRGIVEPNDDFRATNPPSNPALLDALARDFIDHRFDLRHVVRAIMSSRTYQLASIPNDTNQDDEANFSHALVRRLSAEQLLDAQNQALDVGSRFNGYPAGFRASQLPGVQAARTRDALSASGDQFLKVFGKPPRLLSCECERSSAISMVQAFQMINGPAINESLSRPDNRLAALLSSGKPARDIIHELYWSALSRPPGAEELESATGYLERAGDQRAALEDVTWGLLNAKEFLLRH